MSQHWTSQRARVAGPEGDALRVGMGWSRADLDRPQVLVETVAGDSHPGSVHLEDLAQRVKAGIDGAGGKGSRYTCTDMCDGIAQGTDAMDYSLPSRDLLAAVAEMHAVSGHFDAVVFVSSCDKAVPAHLMAAARLNIPALHVPGGAMAAGRDNTTVDQIGSIAARLRRGEMDVQEYRRWVDGVVPSCGACAFMGTALTSQVLAEVIGLALPHSAVAPADGPELRDMAARAGRVVLGHHQRNLTARSFITASAIRNAVTVHAAIGGSTNFLLHLPAIAAEAEQDFDLRELQKINDATPYLLNTRPTGKHPANLFWNAGGVPRLMWELRDLLELDALCGTGESWGDELERRADEGEFAGQPSTWTSPGLASSEVLRPRSQPVSEQGAIAILYGNLAPSGAVVKRSGVHPDARRITGPAQVFERQEDALDAIAAGRITQGSVLVIRNEGPRGSGMPEQYYVTAAIAADPLLSRTTAIVTDGRFSGASHGPCIGHVSPEAAAGGPIALLRTGDQVAVDIDGGTIDLVGDATCATEHLSPARGDALLRDRGPAPRAQGPAPRPSTRYLDVYRSLAGSPASGGVLRSAVPR